MCGYCKGEGRRISEPCETCHGEGSSEHLAKLNIRIPPGAEDGSVLRCAGEGEAGPVGSQNGDLLITLSVLGHPLYRRQGADVYCEVPITFAEAALGAQIEVPTLHGQVRMKIPEGTQPGSVFRLRGKGVPAKNSTAAGDQHVTVIIETPSHLTEKQASWIEQLNKIDTEKHYPKRAEFWRKVQAD